MHLPLTNEDIKTVLDVYPFAFLCFDTHGCYITSDATYGKRDVIIGRGKKPLKAWHDAAKTVLKQKKKGSKATRPKTPKKKDK